MRNCALYIGHFVAGTVIAIVISSALFYVLKPILMFLHLDAIVRGDMLLLLPLFPFQALVSFVMGIQQTRYIGPTKGRRGLWIWIPPLLWFLLWTLAEHGHVASSLLFSSSFQYKRIQLFTTLPLVTALCYSLGTSVGVRFRRTVSPP